MSLDWIAGPIVGGTLVLAGAATWVYYYFCRWRVGAKATDFGDRRRALLEQWETMNAWNVHPPYCVVHTEYVRPNPADGRLVYTYGFRPRDESAAAVVTTPTTSTTAATSPPKAIVVFVHGINDHSSGLKLRYAHFLVQHGYAVHGFDLLGHGRSDGLHVHVPSFDIFVDDTRFIIERVRKLYASTSSSAAPRVFLLAESMGGAVAYLFAQRHPQFVDGVIFLSPMLQIAEHIKPPAFVVRLLMRLAAWFPTYPLAASKDILPYVFHRKELLRLALASPIYYDRLPRLETALRALRVTEDISASFDTFERPFLALHGDADRVTDPNGSINLHKRARATDKTLKLYPGAWHSLLLGEDDETIAQVQRDICEWIEARA